MSLNTEKYHIFFRTKEKPNENPERKNEDALEVLQKQQQIVFALSDGAGGAGLLSAKWSDTLVTRCLEILPTKNNLNQWLDDFSFNFFRDEKEKISDLFKKTKFSKEGSFATLVTGQINLKKHDISLITYGDSLFFHFNNNWDLEGFIPQLSLTDFLKNPYLINWKNEIYNHKIQEYQASIKVGDKLIIASDALSLLILSLYKLKNAKSDELQIILQNPLKNKLNQTVFNLKKYSLTLNKVIRSFQNDFTETIAQLYKTNLLLKDDYSIIVIERDE